MATTTAGRAGGYDETLAGLLRGVRDARRLDRDGGDLTRWRAVADRCHELADRLHCVPSWDLAKLVRYHHSRQFIDHRAADRLAAYPNTPAGWGRWLRDEFDRLAAALGRYALPAARRHGAWHLTEPAGKARAGRTFPFAGLQLGVAGGFAFAEGSTPAPLADLMRVCPDATGRMQLPVTAHPTGSDMTDAGPAVLRLWLWPTRSGPWFWEGPEDWQVLSHYLLWAWSIPAAEAAGRPEKYTVHPSKAWGVVHPLAV